MSAFTKGVEVVQDLLTMILSSAIYLKKVLVNFKADLQDYLSLALEQSVSSKKTPRTP